MSQAISKPLSSKVLREKLRRPVRGRFRNLENPGTPFKFSYRRFKEDPIEHFTFEDNQVYTIPLGVANHLNENCSYPVYQFVPGDPNVQQAFNGHNTMKIRSWVHRVEFHNLEFGDVEGFVPSKKLAEVEFVAKP